MRDRTTAFIGSALFLILAPGTVAGLVPWWMTGWRAQASFLGSPLFSAIGFLLIAVGALALLDSFIRFALSFGTPAPIAPTRGLVVSGLYRYVRNPMYLAVVSLILGQGLLLGSTSLLIYAAILWLCFHIFILAYEEPTLKRSFGAEYDSYRRNVGRWLPRITPWRAGG